MTVYLFMFNDCIWESAAQTMSIHRTRKGAEMALDFHAKEWIKESETLPDDEMQYWGVREMKVND